MCLFQITIEPDYGIKGHSINRLIKWLPQTIKNIFTAFGVCPECREHYSKTQNLSNIVDISPGGNQPLIQQSRLALTEDEKQDVAINWLFKIQ